MRTREIPPAVTLLCTFHAVLLLGVSQTAAQSTGTIRGTIVNGTTGDPGYAEMVTLYDLSAGMEAVALVEDVNGTFTLEDFEIQGQRPFLLQASSNDVSYSQTIRFSGADELEAVVTVYENTREWKDLEVTTARYLLRREHDRLRIDKLLVGNYQVSWGQGVVMENTDFFSPRKAGSNFTTTSANTAGEFGR